MITSLNSILEGPIWINSDYVVSFTPHENGTSLKMSDGSSIVVEEKPQLVCRQFIDG